MECNSPDKPSIFRSEAVAARLEEVYGSVRVFTPWPIKALAIVAMGFCVMIALVIAFGSYAQQSRGFGRLVPSAGLIEIASPSNGIVKKVEGRQADTVAVGQRLATIELDRSSSTIRSASHAEREAWLSQKRLIEDSAQAKVAESQEQRKTAETSLALLAVQRRQLRIQKTNIERQRINQADLLLKLRELEKSKFASVMQIRQQEMSLTEIENQLSNVEAKDADLEMQVRKQIEVMTNSNRLLSQVTNDLKIQLLGVGQKINESELSTSPIVRAPVSGTIVASNASAGKAVDSGEKLFTLLPLGSELQAELLATGEAIGQIRKGAVIRLRYKAFPYQHFGLQTGTVDEVSNSAMSPAQATAVYGQRIDQPVYRIKVRLGSQAIKQGGATFRLLPGMEVEGYFLLERRRLFQWMLGPINRLASKSGVQS